MITTLMTAGLSCREVTELASAFVDGEISGTLWLRFRVHLLACGPCAEYLEQIRLTVDTLKDLETDEGAEMRGELMRQFREWSEQDGP